MKGISRMSEKQNLDKDLIYSMQVTRMILRATGIWPITNHSSLRERIVRRTINCVCYFVYIVIIVPSVLQIIKKEKNFQVRLRLCGPLINCCMSCIEYTILLFRTKEVTNGTKQMSEDWRNVSTHDRKILMNKALIGRKLVYIAAMFMYGGGLCYRTLIPLSKGLLKKTNSTVRYLPCPGYYVKFNEQETPAYEILLGVQFFAVFVVYSVRCGLCGLSAFFVMHVCGQLGILIDRLNTLAKMDNMEDTVVDERISVIVGLQIKAWAFLKYSEKIIRYVCMVEIMGCTIVTCLVGYYILELERQNFGAVLGYLVIGISFVFNIFIFCYIGQCLVNESSEVGLASCTIDWYRLPIKKARYLLLIVAASNSPMKVTAGKMVDMCFSGFASVMKTSVAYLNMLRTVS